MIVIEIFNQEETMKSRSLVDNRTVDLPKTIWNISGLLTIGILDISILAGAIWGLKKFLELQTLAATVLYLIIMVGIGLVVAFGWTGKDEYEPY